MIIFSMIRVIIIRIISSSIIIVVIITWTWDSLSIIIIIMVLYRAAETHLCRSVLLVGLSQTTCWLLSLLAEQDKVLRCAGCREGFAWLLPPRLRGVMGADYR